MLHDNLAQNITNHVTLVTVRQLVGSKIHVCCIQTSAVALSHCQANLIFEMSHTAAGAGTGRRAKPQAQGLTAGAGLNPQLSRNFVPSYPVTFTKQGLAWQGLVCVVYTCLLALGTTDRQ